MGVRLGSGPLRVWELDMPTPEGLSGAPVFGRPGGQASNRLVGLVFGTNKVATVEAFKSRDPKTGEERPEILHVVSFGLAHVLPTILELRGKHAVSAPANVPGAIRGGRFSGVHQWPVLGVRRG